ncbi:MAG TPA: SRPBCC family protein [Ktedonobacteraceae bacterium]|nr:SRPBCC family protein [Ktedonobacteraceae bacterium]
MSHIFVRSERIIEAKPTDVFQTLADYEMRRPRILPPNYLDYAIKQGGQGSGTVVSYRLRAAGRERPYEMQVEETVRGQVLTERDKGSSLVTRWCVLPIDGGRKSKVSVESDWEGSSGIGGFFERTFAPLGLNQIYKDILVALALIVQQPAQNQDLLKAQEKRPTARIGLSLAILGSALALAVGLKYLRTRTE